MALDTNTMGQNLGRRGRSSHLNGGVVVMVVVVLDGAAEERFCLDSR